jgi:UDP-2,3-diacylglucosamine hydrolase
VTTLFISDLHLDASRPEITSVFLRFLANEAAAGEALYILGDLFESWVGDDDESEVGELVAAGLRSLSNSGIPIRFIHGNRDFLLGDTYARRAGMQIIPDCSKIDLYGSPTLLLHGDILCTDDSAYQTFRAQVRSPQWQSVFLAKSLAERHAFAEMARQRSRSHTATSPLDIMDVNPVAVCAAFNRFGVDRMIHGHTHRPKIHRRECTEESVRTVLGDWYTQDSVLRVEPSASS